MIENVTLIMMDGWNPATNMVESRYFGTHGFTSRPDDTPANVYFEPIVSNPGMFSQSIYAPGTTGGQSSGGWGFVEMANPAGEFDYLVDWGFDGRRCVILDGPANGSLADFATVMTGTIEQLEFSWDKITLRFKDRIAELDKPVALNYYLGNNVLPDGVEGAATDIIEMPKPRVFSVAFHVVPVCVNTSKLVYQVNDGSVLSIQVRDSGVSIATGVYHADTAALLAATVAPGTVDRCLSSGLFRVGSTPGELMCLVSAATISIGQIIRQLVVEKIGASSVCEQSFIDLDKIYPSSTQTVCYAGTSGKKDLLGNITGVTTVKQILDELSQAGLWWGFDNNGIFWVKQMSAPEAGRPLTELDQSNILSVERVATQDSGRGVPVWKVSVNYLKNPNTNPVLAGSVQADTRLLYTSPSMKTASENTTIKTVHPLATELVIDSPFFLVAPAAAEASRQLAMRSVRRDRLRVQAPIASIAYPTGGYWDDESITELPAPRYGHCTVIADQRYLYVIGGVVGGAVSASVIRLDLSNPTGGWDDAGVPDLPLATTDASAVVYLDHYIYVVCGRRSLATGSVSEIMRLDVRNMAAGWARNAITNAPSGYRSHACTVYNDTLILVGGYPNASVVPYSDVLTFNLINPSGVWTLVNTTYPISAAGIGLAISGTTLYAVGGIKSGGIVSAATYTADATNLEAGWDTGGLPDLTTPRHGVGVVVGTPNAGLASLYIVGGIKAAGVASAEVQRWISGSSTWASMTDFPESRGYIGVIWSRQHPFGLYTVGGYSTGVSPKGNTWKLRLNENPDDRAHLTSLGRTVSVKLPRYGYTAGKNMKIIGVELDQSTRKIALDLWG